MAQVLLGMIFSAIVFALGATVGAMYLRKEHKTYEPGEWDCEAVRFPKFKDGQVFRSGECVLWRKIIDERYYDEEDTP